jgi:hypothetical protein
VWRLLTWSPSLLGMLAAPIQLARGVATTVELHNLQKMAIHQRQMNGDYPAEDAFGELVAREFRSMGKNPGLDSWGKSYAYRRIAGGFELRSAGPDRHYNTKDDLKLTWKEGTA